MRKFMPAITALRQQFSQLSENWFESPSGGARLLPMEGLRGLAVLVVFFVHAHAFFGPYLFSHTRLFSVSEYLGRVGNAGVDLFFVLSGFMIYGALVQRRVTYFTFLRRRVKRIYPTFLAVLAGYLVLSVVFPSESKIPAHSWAAAKYIAENIFFLPGFFPIVSIITVAWSLSFEFAFYLSVPLIVLLLSHGKNDRVRRIALLSALWVGFVLLEAFFQHGTHIRMLSFLSGMLLQETVASGSVRSFVTAKLQWASVSALVVIASYHFAFEPKDWATRASGVFCVALMSVAIFCFVLSALEFPGTLQEVCTWKPLRYWGNISYSYYLAHGITLKALATLLARMQPREHSVLTYFGAIVVGLAASWVTASLLYLLVEKPLSLTSKKQRAPIEIPAPASFPLWMRRDGAAAEASGNR
jgi:exopolysaccharide production protein ExoZ